MRFFSTSLRVRLAILILAPLVLVSVIAVYWRYEAARDTAEEIFDRNLVMLCLAVSRDVSNSGGDSLSETTANLFRQFSGGQVFYHVYGPDGSFVTGYSSPPVGRQRAPSELNTPALFDAVHQGRPVRAASLAEQVEIDGIAGVSVVTVWQDISPRQTLARTLASRAAILAAILLLTVAVVVFLGIRRGLRPLNELEAAIQKRSTADLSPIERHIPAEAQGIVTRLNDLFGKLTQAKTNQDRLISNAAHQLRNPVAAIHALAQATQSAPDPDAAKARAADLVDETRQTMRLIEQLLSFERIRGQEPVLTSGDVNALVQKTCERVAPDLLRAGLNVEVDMQPNLPPIEFHATLLGEAILNLIDNAVKHGGPGLSVIRIATTKRRNRVLITVENDGSGFSVPVEQALERFTQGQESNGAGLGLPIIQEIANLHHGQLIFSENGMTKASLDLPIPA